MGRASAYVVIPAPREGVNDDVVRLSKWLVADGQKVEANRPIAVLETAKATFDLEAPSAGFLFRLAAEDAEVAVGAPLALLSEGPQRPAYEAEDETKPAAVASADQLITKKALALMNEHGLAPEAFAGLPVVRTEDVEKLVHDRQAASRPAAVRTFAGEPLDPEADWDAALRTEFHAELSQLLTHLRKRMKAKFNRHVPTSDLLYDRWDLARDYGFGEGTSVYDECLILGDVKVGRHCWVGPYTILDGMHAPLEIGDHVDIGAGTHVYTHNTIERSLTGHKAALFKKATRIGNCCFIAPMSIIAPGTTLGDHCFVSAGSYVEGSFPAYSYVAGNPARRVGVVELDGDRARLRREHA
jgi:acetyltransferase-like isoleucine patch superfamily enzyme